jgi:hypothetical protein
MLSSIKQILMEYIILLAKMAKDGNSFPSTHVNWELLCDVKIILGFTCLLPMLVIVHSYIKFIQCWDVLCVTIKLCKKKLYTPCMLIQQFVLLKILFNDFTHA